jgi:hypothetical protein
MLRLSDDEVKKLQIIFEDNAVYEYIDFDNRDTCEWNKLYEKIINHNRAG